MRIVVNSRGQGESTGSGHPVIEAVETHVVRHRTQSEGCHLPLVTGRPAQSSRPASAPHVRRDVQTVPVSLLSDRTTSRPSSGQ
jgi:hypothetical protein